MYPIYNFLEFDMKYRMRKKRKPGNNNFPFLYYIGFIIHLKISNLSDIEWMNPIHD